MIGEAGLTTALHDAGYTLTERNPDYVVLGETRTYSFERITHAIRLVAEGARFIATNPDATGPSPDGPLPATGSVAALVSRATGIKPYFVGKPNPLMMRSALNAIDAHSETAAMIGDRMDTDIVSGMEAGMETILVLTGLTSREDAELHPYRAARVVDSIADLVDEVRAVARVRQSRSRRSYAGRVRNSTNSLGARERHLLEDLARQPRAALAARTTRRRRSPRGSSPAPRWRCSRTSSGVIVRPSSSCAPWRTHCHTCEREISAVAASSISP